jgi:DNA-binding GntR family transcriptional regulator
MDATSAGISKRVRSKAEIAPLPDDLSAVAPSATDKVTDAITRGIRAGTFVPGQHLLEPELTRRLNISRGSLREALKHLAAAGIVTLSRYRGAYIGILDRKSVLDLLDVLEPLARLAARLAAEHCTTEEKRARILQAAAALETADKRGSRSSYLEQRKLFYDTMVDLGGNKELSRTMPLARTDLFRAQLETVQNEQQRSRHASGYSKIAQAIADRDAAAADRAVKRHFDGTRKTMEELPNSAFASFDED